MRTYRLERRLSHADVDFLGELKVAALLGLLEQAAVEASADAGFDPAWYTRAGSIWIIHRTRLRRHLPVGGRDTLVVSTHIADFRRVRSLRRYVVERDGELVADATTDWVYCDLASGRPIRVPEAMQQTFLDGDASVSLPRAPSLPAGGDERPVELPFVVQPSHLDHVAHMNNAVYASCLEDGAFAFFGANGWALEHMLATGGALRPQALDVEYLSDARVAEHVCIRTWPVPGTAAGGSDTPPEQAKLLQTITRLDGSVILRARSDWVWRRKPAVVGAVPTAEPPRST